MNRQTKLKVANLLGVTGIPRLFRAQEIRTSESFVTRMAVIKLHEHKHTPITYKKLNLIGNNTNLTKWEIRYLVNKGFFSLQEVAETLPKCPKTLLIKLGAEIDPNRLPYLTESLLHNPKIPKSVRAHWVLEWEWVGK